MKKIFTLFLFHLMTLGLFAQETPCPPVHHFMIGPNYARGYVKPSGFPSFKGNLGGMQGVYEYKPFDFLYAGARLDWRYGKLHAGDGKRTLLDVDVHERLGYTFSFFNKDLSLTLFSGFGYRHLSHDLKLNHRKSIDLRYNHFYVPVGVMTDYTVNSWFSIGANGTWMGQVFSSVALSPIGGTYWKIKKKFKNCLIEMPLTFVVQESRNLSLVLTPFFEFWQDGSTTGRSPSGTSLGLPKNTYIFWGGELSLKASF
ncbi:MAG: hypothetical protein KFB93_07425 [Simkaniaceae bacterium]|nr:MAG: hypothetical protein KFB93_07425 [Simkaniaceae bacterium]